MKMNKLLFPILCLLLPLTATAQSVKITGTYLDENKNITDGDPDSGIEGDAPLEVTFRANPQNMDGHTAAYEWHFRKDGEEQDFMVRYEEDTQYTFAESGSFNITLKTRITDTDSELAEQTITVKISESHLEMPNAFSPNDDKINDRYGAKGINDTEGKSPGHYRSIVSFHAWIFNRWGQKLYEWTDVSGSWDGTYKGSPVKEGVYFVLVKAKGADGREYNIKRDVNLLRGYTEGTSTSSTEE